MKHFDVIVIGAGHAGTEAAAASARLGARTALLTMKKADVGTLSCNPAIGGLGKGHLVREIDALDGLMGRVADLSGIQFRLLNRKKGPAVHGPRAQMDRRVYRRTALHLLMENPGLQLIESEVAGLLGDDHSVTGVKLSDGSEIKAAAVVLTTGTFLNGVIHIGEISRSAGRWGNGSSVALAESLRRFDLPLGRLKTGTPPRLDGKTVNWDILTKQPGDDDPVTFSYLTKTLALPQISCGITQTNQHTHDIISNNLTRSALYGGKISGKGPRYCPSIEDKVVRFAEKDSHQIFLEPEGLNDSTVYPNGISTSLPEEVQREYVRSIVGLEQVEILQPGYAVEYDYVDPRALDASLKLKNATGLFLAGQINGTTGYEEAAGQGLVAGLNASLAALGREPIIFSRTTSYIGVMVDDLISRGVTEPYRMFTSRAEFRLTVRADNADQRLTPLGIEIGCVMTRRAEAFRKRQSAYEGARSRAERERFSPNHLENHGVYVRQDGRERSLFALIGLNEGGRDMLSGLSSWIDAISDDTYHQLKCDALYHQYAARQQRDAEALRSDEAIQLPQNLDYTRIAGLSNELASKLETVRPATIAMAAKIEGITPAALTLLIGIVRSNNRKRA